MFKIRRNRYPLYAILYGLGIAIAMANTYYHGAGLILTRQIILRMIGCAGVGFFVGVCSWCYIVEIRDE